MTETVHAEIARLRARLAALDERMAETSGRDFMNATLRRGRRRQMARLTEEPADVGAEPGQAGSSSPPPPDMNRLIRQAAGRKEFPR